jgi:hypothetical protein
VMGSLGIFTLGSDFIILRLVRVLMGGTSN